MQTEPTRLTVFCGFLGSGKTTFLRHQLRTGALKPGALIINEAATVPVDPELLPGLAVAVLSGGCACCTARERLIDLLRELLAATTPPPAHILLETSGLADPGPIVAAIEAVPEFAGRLIVTEVVTFVDAVYGGDPLRQEPLARAQVAGAKALVLTKLDQCPPAVVAALAAGLQMLNPQAHLFGAVKGVDQALPPHADAMPEDFAQPGAEHPTLQALTLALPPGTDWAVLSLWVAAVLQDRGDQMLRMKAVVRSSGRRMLLQTVRQSMQAPEILPEQPDAPGDGHLAILGRNLSADSLSRSLRRFVQLAENSDWHQET